jgi:F0F1-type ATP synthase assembly protein I
VNPAPSPLLQFIPLILLSLPIGFLANRLAKDKGRNVIAWTILGFIPIINFMMIWYFAGAKDKLLHAKIDRLLVGHEFK